MRKYFLGVIVLAIAMVALCGCDPPGGEDTTTVAPTEVPAAVVPTRVPLPNPDEYLEQILGTGFSVDGCFIKWEWPWVDAIDLDDVGLDFFVNGVAVGGTFYDPYSSVYRGATRYFADKDICLGVLEAPDLVSQPWVITARASMRGELSEIIEVARAVGPDCFGDQMSLGVITVEEKDGGGYTVAVKWPGYYPAFPIEFYSFDGSGGKTLVGLLTAEEYSGMHWDYPLLDLSSETIPVGVWIVVDDSVKVFVGVIYGSWLG